MSAPSRPPLPAAPQPGVAGDLWGGFAAMLVALPSSIAYGVAVYSVLGPEYAGHGVRTGIVGAMVLGLLASLLGGAPRLISSPCAPAGAVLASLATSLLALPTGAVAPDRIIALLLLLALMSGILQLGYGLVGGGRLIKYIPFPVVSGYLSAVGLLIFISQLPKFLGVATADLFSPAHWQGPAVIVGTVTVAAVLLAPKLTRAVPATIFGLVAGIVTYFVLAIFRPELLQLAPNKLIIGPVGSGKGGVFAGVTTTWPTLATLRLSDLGLLLPSALTLSVLLSVDTLKTCVVVDSLTHSRHDSNRTLIGQGAGNLASALVGGMPGAGTMGATLVSVESGGATRRAGLVEGVCVLLAALLLGNLVAWVPVAALAGILLVVAVRMFDWGSFALLRQKSTMLDFAVIATVIIVAVTTNLMAASGAGVGLAMLLFIREQIRGSVIRRKIAGNRISSTQHRLPAEQALLELHGAQTVVCELQGSLFFGTTDQLRSELEADLGQCRWLILDLRRVQSMDYTAAHLFEQFERTLAARQGGLLFSRLPARRDLQEYFTQVGVVSGQAGARKFDTLDDALQWAEDQILAECGAGRSADEAPLELVDFDLCREFTADQTLATLAECTEARSFAAGQVIFAAGDPADELYLIRRGVVRIVLPLTGSDHHNLASFGRGSFFGEVAFLDRGVRSATAVATSPVDMFVISRARFDEKSRAQPLIGVKIFARIARTLALRLRHSDRELSAFYHA
ncbi:MAG TPA: SulP family inorganic anion transporter [Lacunisphaera sp.]|nr:SulP family inorganic anion transporter [Lacunisphaera sp.]